MHKIKGLPFGILQTTFGEKRLPFQRAPFHCELLNIRKLLLDLTHCSILGVLMMRYADDGLVVY